MVMIFMKAKVRTIKQKVLFQPLPKKFTRLMLTRKNTANSQAAKPQAKQLSAANSQLGTDTFLGNILELEDGKRIVQEWTSTDWEEGYPASRLELCF